MNFNKNQINYNNVIQNFQETFFNKNDDNKIFEETKNKVITSDRKEENKETFNLKSKIFLKLCL